MAGLSYFVANGLSRQATKKGIFDNLRNTGEKSRRFFSGEEESPNKTNNSRNSNASNGTHDENFGHSHNKTPSNLNMSNYSTSEGISQAKKDLDALDPHDAGKKAIKNSISETMKGMPKRSPERTAGAQMLDNLRKGRPIDAEKFSALTGFDAPTGKNGAVNISALGENVKAADYSRLDSTAHAFKHPTPEAQSWIKKAMHAFTRTKTGRTLFVL